MDPTVSVSKGCFVFNAPAKKQRVSLKTDPLPFHKERWYTAYTALWKSIDKKLQKVYSNVYSEMLKDLVDYVQHTQDEPATLGETVPVAALLTGVNMPDHVAMFAQLRESLRKRVTPHVVTLDSCNCPTIRSTIEQIVYQLISSPGDSADRDYESGDDEDDEELDSNRALKKQQCNIITLEAWYRELLENNIPPNHPNGAAYPNESSPVKNPRQSECKTPVKTPKSARRIETELQSLTTPTKTSGRPVRGTPTKRRSPTPECTGASPATRKKQSGGRPIIVIVIPNFEGFNMKVLQTLLTIASSKSEVVPITFVFGVATSVQALQQGLSYRVSSKLGFEVFQSQKSLTFLDLVLERVFLTPDCPFQLGGKTFKLFCEVFLFYDFSVEAFIQHFKFCLMEHFFEKDMNSLCCSLEQLDERVASLSKADLDQLRKLPSFQAYRDKCSKNELEQLNINSNIDFKREIQRMVINLRSHSSNFYVILKVLNVLCSTLPTAPLGKHIRKLYENSISNVIYESTEYKECFKMLGLQSRDELMEKLEKVTAILSVASIGDDDDPFNEPIAKLCDLSTRLGNAGMTIKKSTPKSPTKSSPKLSAAAVVDSAGKKISRSQFLSNMKAGCSKQDQPRSEYEIAREDLINYLSLLLPPFLKPLTTLPLHELLLFDNANVVKRHIIGSPRAAIHMALNDPHYYLQCECCLLASRSTVQASLPDLCIAYKLHLECGKLINLYDWLQAFASVINAEHDADTQISSEIQARFASSVSELQLLGFIKSSKKKADHVSRLTYNPR